MRYLTLILIMEMLFMIIAVDSHAFKYGNIDIDLLGRLDTTYDDNITYVSSEAKSDIYSTPSFGFDAKYEGKRLFLNIGADVNQDIFYTYNTFNNMNENAIIDLRYELSKHDTFTLKDKFTHDYEPRSFEAAFGRLGGRYGYYWNSLDAALAHEISKQLLVNVTFANYVSLYDRSDLSDSVMNEAGFQLQYALSTDTLVFASYDYSIRTFDTGGSPYFNMLTGGFRQYVTKKLYVEAYVGVQLIRTVEDTTETKPYYKASLIGDLDENTKASISYINESSTVSYSKNTFTRWQISANFMRKLTERLSGNASAFFGQGEYQIVDTTNDYAGVKAGLTYDITRDMQGSINYIYSKNDSNVNSDDYVKNVIKVAIKARF